MDIVMTTNESLLSETSLMKSELNATTNNNNNVVENLVFMDSHDEVAIGDRNHADYRGNTHTPSPMVTRSCFNDSGNCDSAWPKASGVFSYSRSAGGAGDSDGKAGFGKYGLYGTLGDGLGAAQAQMTHSWIACAHQAPGGPSCSPEMVRRTDIIFEENSHNDNNGDMEEDDNVGSDYSDRSQSPINSVSSDESTDSSSNSSANNSPEETPCQEHQEVSIETFNSQKPEQENRFIDFNCIFLNNTDDEFSGKRYHQPPKAIDREAAKRLARRLFDCDGFKITDVAKHLSKRNDFSQIVGEEFANFFDLTNMRLDVALRLFLGKFTLTGDTQERERIMHHFSKRFVICNNDIYNGEDACHTLVCALIILNTNLHSQTFPKMTCSDFINNLKDLNDGDNFPTENLEELYLAIEKEPIRWPLDDELVGIVNLNKTDMMDMSKQLINTAYTFGYDEPRDSNCRDFMSGYVVRKWLKEPGGRKTAFGKRGWKLYYGRLRDLTIYLYKDHDKSYSQPKEVSKHQNSVKKVKIKSSKRIKKSAGVSDCNYGSNENPAVYDATDTDSSDLGKLNQLNGNNDKTSSDSVVTANNSTQNPDKKSKDLSPSTDGPSAQSTVIKLTTTDSVEADAASKNQPSLILPPADSEIHIHHAYASRATDYVKKKNVFRIKTKYGSEYLFQVNNEKEMDSWIDNINYVAALLSDPEPIIGISTMEKLSSRSIPRPKITNFNVRSQLDSHQKCVLELEKIISNLKENPPKKCEKKNRLEFDESIRFREEELLRYKTYCQLLEFEIAKMQNLTSMRCIPSGDVPFFCQPYQVSGLNQPVLIPPNQGIILNQQLLNGISNSDTTTATATAYMTNPLLFNQSSLRFRPPLLHNLVAVSHNRRVRYRNPHPVSSSVTNVPSINSPSGGGGGGGGVGGSSEQIACIVTTSANTDSPIEASVFNTTSTSTFYEIV